ncbi:MAG: alkene reductase [Melioribacteraceae bacterium]
MEKKLFSTYRLGNLELKNRVVMSPMTRSRAIGNIPNDLMAEYYSLRADAGLLITEGTSPSPNGLGYSRIPGIYSKDQVTGWKKVTNAVQEKGGKIFVQMMHTGRVAHPLNMPENARVIAPSQLQLEGSIWTDQKELQPYPAPKEMNIQEIKEAINEFTVGAKNAIEAGFDGIELHGANGYLIEQFISPITNQRTDEYGGSIENRIKFVLEVAQKTVDTIGGNKVGIRVSPYGAANGMKFYDDIEETYALLAKKLNEIGIVYIHIADHSSMGAPEVKLSVKKSIRDNFKGTVILAGGYNSDKAEKDLDEDKGDLVAFGRPFISNPDLVTKLKNGTELTKPDSSTFYSPGAEGYTDY